MTRVVATALLLALAAPAAPAQGVDPILVRGRRADVLVYAPAARDSAADARRLSDFVVGCRVAMEIASADSADVVNRPSPPFPLDVWQVRDAIVIAVLATPDRLVDCDDPRTQAALAPVRGLRITLDTTYAPARDLTEVVVRRGDRVLLPLVVERHTVRRLGAGGFRVPREAWLRLAFDRAELAPGPTGSVDDLTVEVVNATASPPERIALPWIAVRMAWESSLAARPVLGATIAPPVALPIPADARLRALHTAYVAGEQERVVQLAAPHFFGATAQAPARRDARTHATMALLALGDTASARVVVATLLQDSPCLSIDAAAPAGVREIFAAARRPVARCTAQTTLHTGVKAALLPGFARPPAGARRDTRMLVFLASVGTTAAAVSLHVKARDQYDDYLAYQAVVGPNAINTDILRLYRDAERTRHASVSIGTIGALVWVGQGVLAIMSERRFAEELRTVQGLGGAPVVRLSPSAGSAGLGLSLSFSW